MQIREIELDRALIHEGTIEAKAFEVTIEMDSKEVSINFVVYKRLTKGEDSTLTKCDVLRFPEGNPELARQVRNRIGDTEFCEIQNSVFNQYFSS